MGGFEFFEHTADVGIHAWGADLPAAFAEAARGLVAYMVEVADAKPVGEAIVEVEGASDERLLFAFLEEVLYLFETQLLVFCEAEVELSPGKLRARLRGEAYDAGKHGHVHEVKAITWHDLEVRRDPPSVRVILDI